MSFSQYPETMNSKDVQMWDNAAFDDGEDFSWSNMKPLSSINLSHQSLESDCTKENVIPSLGVSEKKTQKGVLEERNLDSEIEEIEKEISRLSSKLEDLRLEKAKRNAKVMEKRGRIVAAKFMDPPKQLIRRSIEERKTEEMMNESGKSKTPRRGMSLGPAEIMRGTRRGISLGPSEIYSATKLKNVGKQEITPIQSSANRRKSCYWKLNDIDELRVTKQRGKCMSLSPKSRSKMVDKPQIPKQASTTIGAKSQKTVKKDDGVGVISLIQPKKLFVEKSGNSKSLSKGGRVVASRYSQISSVGNSALKELRKRSLPENEELKRSEKKRVSLVAKSEETVQKNAVPRIKTYRCTVESPRDSGPAKRVSELVGKKSFFSEDDGESVSQALSFEEEKTTKEYPKIRVLRPINESPRNSGPAKRVSQLVGRKSFFAADDEEEMPVFSFEEEGFEGNCMEIEDVLL